MRFTLNGYEIEIKAKYTAGGLFDTDKRMNKADTIAVLNLVNIWAFKAAESFESDGCPALGLDAEKAAGELHDQLKEVGAFKR